MRFHGSMKKGVHVNPRHDAAISQQDFFAKMNNMFEVLEDLEFLYAHGEQFEEYTLKEEQKFDEDEKLLLAVPFTKEGRRLFFICII
jgi:hypothetical protein